MNFPSLRQLGLDEDDIGADSTLTQLGPVMVHMIGAKKQPDPKKKRTGPSMRWVDDTKTWIEDPYYLEDKFDPLQTLPESGPDESSESPTLKELEKKISVEKVQRMTEQWSKLHTIYGLDKLENHSEVVSWLREHRPGIRIST